MCDKEQPICEQCGKTFSSNSTLYKHLREKHATQPLISLRSGIFKCHLCEGSFKQQTNLRRHLKVIHNFEKTDNRPKKNPLFMCDQCPRTYHQKKGLQRHIKEAHSEPQPKSEPTIFECEICLRKMSNKSNLTMHLKNIHFIYPDKRKYDENDLERFHCEYCDKSYKKKKHLNHHIRNTHPDVAKEIFPAKDHFLEDEKRLRCLLCLDTTFSCKYALGRHMKHKHGAVASSLEVTQNEHEDPNDETSEEEGEGDRDMEVESPGEVVEVVVVADAQQKLSSLMSIATDLSTQIDDIDVLPLVIKGMEQVIELMEQVRKEKILKANEEAENVVLLYDEKITPLNFECIEHEPRLFPT